MRCLRIGQPITSLVSRYRVGSSSLAQTARPSASIASRRSLAVCFVDHSGYSSPELKPEAGSMFDEDVASLFNHAMPKVEIGALRFLQSHPQYDGRGVKICIFDTGVDPGAAGLQITTDGKPKIIDVIDCTGSGDVDTSRREVSDADGWLTGASGRRLRIRPHWVNPSGEWRVGCKHVYSLVSKSLVSRLKEERRKKWDEAHRKATAEAMGMLAKFDKDNPASKLAVDASAKKQRAELEGRVNAAKDLAKQYEDPGPLIDAVVWHDGTHWRAALDTQQLHPPGSGRGLLADFTPLTNFAIEHQYGTFSDLDACNFALNILDDGALLSIVVDCGAHGTHVAGITAAHFPGDPGSNGIAPGAQIISCKIGDTRLGSMETGPGLVRGLVAARQHGADLINMSYGEPTSTPNQGRFIALATELVRTNNVIFVASAGNAGPALSTVGAPGGTSSALFGVGAYVSPQLAAAGHSVLAAPPRGLQYNWSSRGPAGDGATGVAFSAPGGAIAPVPQWTQQRRQLMNGTSMSSPNACGGIALLLSGLLAAGGAIAPHTVRRALENTALPLGGDAPDAVLTYGRGLIQIDAAWDYLLRDGVTFTGTSIPLINPTSTTATTLVKALPMGPLGTSATAPDTALCVWQPPPAPPPPPPSVSVGPWYEVEVAGVEGRGPRGRGIYLREPHEGAKAQGYRVTVTPKFKATASPSDHLEVEERLSVESNVPWVTCPSALLMHSAGRSFEILVDPTRLPPGLHYGEVWGLQVEARERGPLFRVPVTVIQPLQVPLAATATHAVVPNSSSTPVNGLTNGNGTNGNGNGSSVGTISLGPLSFTQGSEFRSFIAVPAGATWAELTIRASPYDTPKLFLLRATQLRPEATYRNHELRTQVTLSGGSEYLTSLPVEGGCTLELTLAQFWSSAGQAGLDQVEMSFYGLEVAAEGGSGGPSAPGTDLALDGAELAKKVLVRIPTWSRSTRIRPEAWLTSVALPLRPVESSLEPLTAERDALPEGRLEYRLVLTYKTTITEPGKYTPCVPLINKQIYDSPLTGQLLLLHDGTTRQLLGVQDADPEPLTLRKGELGLRLALRSESPELLERVRGLPLLLKRSLEGGAVTVPVYGSRRDAILALGGGGGGVYPAGEMLLRPGDVAPLWVGPVPEEKLPKDAAPGRLLTGQLSLGLLKRGGGFAPSSLTISYLVPPSAPTASNGVTSAGQEEAGDKSPEGKLQEALRDAKIRLLKDLKLSDGPQSALYDSLMAELRASYPSHLPLLTEHLKKLDGREAAVRRTPGGLAAVVTAADDVIAAIDTTALSAFLGTKATEDTPDYRKTKKAMDEAKAAFVDALARKAAALMEAEELSAALAPPPPAVAAAADGSTAAAVPPSAAGASSDSAFAEESGVASETSEATGGPEVEVEVSLVEGAALVEGHLAPSSGGAVEVPVAAGGGEAVAVAAPVDLVAACMQELRKWSDPSSESGLLLLHARVEARAKRYATALKAIDKLAGSDDKSATSAACRKELSDLKCKWLAALGWTHAEAQERYLQPVRFPKDLALM